MEVVITGASGFIGSNLIDLFNKKKIKFSVIASSSRSKKKIKKKFKKIIFLKK